MNLVSRCSNQEIVEHCYSSDWHYELLTARQLATHASQLMPNGRAAPSSVSMSPVCTIPVGRTEFAPTLTARSVIAQA
jgi:hypothetical protein